MNFEYQSVTLNPPRFRFLFARSTIRHNRRWPITTAINRAKCIRSRTDRLHRIFPFSTIVRWTASWYRLRRRPPSRPPRHQRLQRPISHKQRTAACKAMLTCTTTTARKTAPTWWAMRWDRQCPSTSTTPIWWCPRRHHRQHRRWPAAIIPMSFDWWRSRNSISLHSNRTLRAIKWGLWIGRVFSTGRRICIILILRNKHHRTPYKLFEIAICILDITHKHHGCSGANWSYCWNRVCEPPNASIHVNRNILKYPPFHWRILSWNSTRCILYIMLINTYALSAFSRGL